MSAAPTPGELAYVAYVRQRYRLPEADAALTYTRSIPEERAAWEAAAQAVLADGRGHARALVQHWHAWHRDAQAPALPLLTAMHALEAWLAQEDDTHA